MNIGETETYEFEPLDVPEVEVPVIPEPAAEPEPELVPEPA